jgi:transcription elongation GreA/GreB family factor
MESRDIQARITKIEQELRELKLDLSRRDEEKDRTENTGNLEIGSRVRILNPKKGQKTQGTIVRIGKETGYITIETKKGKVVRHKSNVTVIAETN